MSVEVGNLFRKRIVRGLDGHIIELVDETDGGVIIERGRIVNQEKYDEMLKIEKDRALAAQAEAHAKTDDNPPPERNPEPVKDNKVVDLENKVGKMEDDIKQILTILKNDSK